MPKVSIPKVLISSAAIFGIGIFWYDFNKKVCERVSHFINIMWCETDQEIGRRIQEEIKRRKENKRIEEEMKRLEEKKRIEEEEEAAGKTD